MVQISAVFLILTRGRLVAKGDLTAGIFIRPYVSERPGNLERSISYKGFYSFILVVQR